MTAKYDLLIKHARVVRPNQTDTPTLDIAIKDGKFALVAPEIAADEAQEVRDAAGMYAFPGLVDAHMHVGIYSPLAEDAVTESRAAAMGGVTSALTYFRTGQYYLNKGGAYRDFYPEVLAISEGKYQVDYGYHLAPIAPSHIGEMEMLATQMGVPSFKIFMFYGGYGLHGKSGNQSDFLMLGEDERYDFAHFEFIMREASRLIEAYPHLADVVSVSLHCEIADILNAYTDIVQKEGKLTGLHAYHAARPPHSEGLAVWIASYLAYETRCANINLLHLSSRKALEAALMMAQIFPHINFRREVTIGHLLLDVDNATVLAKVNPPIRPREDVEFLWEALLNRQVDWVTSDHACCRHEVKVNEHEPDNIWLAKSGFGGTEYILSGLYTAGKVRGMSLNHMAELLSANPAKRYGLTHKGDIAVGLDADLALFDPNHSFVVRAADSPSTQG
ncbi:MAG TPA: dihydroorotase family protein, partial [Phototrophicaceae bacterium]|nr:dihydroorotase family protein [Phototrophicaceae bacterium]